MSPQSARRRVLDASMELLNSIQRDTIDPEYAERAATGLPARSRAPWLVVIVGLLAGLMFTTSALSGGRGTPAAATERAELLAQIAAAEQRNIELRGRAEALANEVQQLEESLGADIATNPDDEIWAGLVPVSGPGVVLVVNDNPRDANGIIVDQDVRQIVNGLWLAGAEAITINGHRLSARTAIRQAGSAVTVDYRSMTTPYRIEAIGDADALVSGFESNSGGAWLNFLRRNYGVTWTIDRSDALELGVDAGLGVDRSEIP